MATLGSSPVSGARPRELHQPGCLIAARWHERPSSIGIFPILSRRPPPAPPAQLAGNAAELVGEDCAGDQAVVGYGGFSFNQVGVDDLVIVVRDVRKGRAALDISQGPDARHIRLQPIVHPDESLLINLHPGVLQSQVVRIGPASGGNQQVGSAHRLRSAATLRAIPPAPSRRGLPARRDKTESLALGLVASFGDIGVLVEGFAPRVDDQLQPPNRRNICRTPCRYSRRPGQPEWSGTSVGLHDAGVVRSRCCRSGGPSGLVPVSIKVKLAFDHVRARRAPRGPVKQAWL